MDTLGSHHILIMIWADNVEAWIVIGPVWLISRIENTLTQAVCILLRLLHILTLDCLQIVIPKHVPGSPEISDIVEHLI